MKADRFAGVALTGVRDVVGGYGTAVSRHRYRGPRRGRRGPALDDAVGRRRLRSALVPPDDGRLARAPSRQRRQPAGAQPRGPAYSRVHACDVDRTAVDRVDAAVRRRLRRTRQCPHRRSSRLDRPVLLRRLHDVHERQRRLHADERDLGDRQRIHDGDGNGVRHARRLLRARRARCRLRSARLPAT